jgi:hypothetical protein
LALIFTSGCFKRQPSEDAAIGDPLADLPVVLGNEALRLEQDTRGIGTLFNISVFEDRRREAEKVKAEREVEIERLQTEINERFAYINAVESIKNNIEKDCAVLPRYLELVNQLPRTNPTGGDLWKAAAVWVMVETTAGKYREFVDDMCTGQMARKYLSISDRVGKSVEARVQPSLSAAHGSFSNISSGYAKETDVSRLREHIESLDKASETLRWVGSEYFDAHHEICMKNRAEKTDARGPTGASDDMFVKTFEETRSDIRVLADNVRLHIGVCRVYNSCMEKFANLMENGLQAKDVKPIERLKGQLTAKEPEAPNKDSAALLTLGREDIDRRVAAEAEKMRRTRDQLEDLCKRQPDFSRPTEYLGQLREGQDELLGIKSVFYALNLFEDAEKADAVKRLTERRVRAFDKLREMHDAQQEMRSYATELQRMPRHGSRTSAQRTRVAEMRKKVQKYRIRFAQYRSDPALEDYAGQSLHMVDELAPQIGE